jgi:hypothetical protein
MGIAATSNRSRVMMQQRNRHHPDHRDIIISFVSTDGLVAS